MSVFWMEKWKTWQAEKKKQKHEKTHRKPHPTMQSMNSVLVLSVTSEVWTSLDTNELAINRLVCKSPPFPSNSALLISPSSRHAGRHILPEKSWCRCPPKNISKTVHSFFPHKTYMHLGPILHPGCQFSNYLRISGSPPPKNQQPSWWLAWLGHPNPRYATTPQVLRDLSIEFQGRTRTSANLRVTKNLETDPRG